MTIGEAQGTRLLPSEFHPENYINAWKEANFSLYMWNSTRITILTLAGELVFSTMAAYAFARIKFPGREIIFGRILKYDDDPSHGHDHSQLPHSDLAWQNRSPEMDQQLASIDHPVYGECLFNLYAAAVLRPDT